MNNLQYAKTVLEELNHTLMSIDPEKADSFVELIDEANEIFCAGAGRSGFQVKGFAMRLMHMGKHSYVVGETCTPNIKEDGLLVICSGSGETKSLVNHASKAKEELHWTAERGLDEMCEDSWRWQSQNPNGYAD